MSDKAQNTPLWHLHSTEIKLKKSWKKTFEDLPNNNPSILSNSVKIYQIMMGKHTNLIKYITLSSKGILAIVITRSQHKFIFTKYLLTSTSNPFVTKTGKTIPILLKLKIHLTTEKKNLLSNSVMRDHLDYSSLTGTIIFFYEIAFCMLLMNKLTKLQGDVRSF